MAVSQSAAGEAQGHGAIGPADAPQDAIINSVALYVQMMMKADKKSTALKTLQVDDWLSALCHAPPAAAMCCCAACALTCVRHCFPVLRHPFSLHPFSLHTHTLTTTLCRPFSLMLMAHACSIATAAVTLCVLWLSCPFAGAPHYPSQVRCSIPPGLLA